MKVINDGTLHAVIENEKIKPCPFCGSADVQLQNTWTAAYWIECNNCGGQMASHVESELDHDNVDDHRLAARLTLNAWNKRA